MVDVVCPHAEDVASRVVSERHRLANFWCHPLRFSTSDLLQRYAIMGCRLHSTSENCAVLVESHRPLIAQHGLVNLVVKFAPVCLIPVLYKPGLTGSVEMHWLRLIAIGRWSEFPRLSMQLHLNLPMLEAWMMEMSGVLLLPFILFRTCMLLLVIQSQILSPALLLADMLLQR